MSFEKIQEIPQPAEIIDRMPLTGDLLRVKKERDQLLAQILKGEDDRFLLIIGPCSADNEKAVLDYMTRLAGLQEEVKDKIIMVPRIYTNKPRTTGEGYKGMVHQPNPSKATDMAQGISAIRHLHLQVIEKTHFTCADEMLYPENHVYLDDLLGYVAVGARSVEDQQHRLTASGLSMPVGMKNPTSGDISIMLNSVQAAQKGHTFIYRGWEVKTQGNPLAHTILRGAVNKYGRAIANYHYEDLTLLIEAYAKRQLANPAVIIDTNHSNSAKDFNQQPRIALEVIRNRNSDPQLKKIIKGLMIESYLVDGRQEVGNGTYGQSITDPCLGWEKTVSMVRDMAEKL